MKTQVKDCNYHINYFQRFVLRLKDSIYIYILTTWQHIIMDMACYSTHAVKIFNAPDTVKLFNGLYLTKKKKKNLFFQPSLIL
jgi:hypothetical protein